MKSGDRDVNRVAETEEEQVMRLRAVLRDLVHRKGRAEAARELGLDPRTVDACLGGEGMSWRVREALERVMQGDKGAESTRQWEKLRALERRVHALEQRKESRPGDAGDGKGMQDEDWAQADRQVETEPGTEDAARETQGPERTSLGRRRYPELVTREPSHDDREVYGGALPLVEEWREIWRAGHRGTGRGLFWLRTEERVRALEVAMLVEHGLTLPPERMPLYGLDRRDQLVWREKALSQVRKALARAELRRVLSFGLWRN